MIATITCERNENAEDVKSASGEYEFQYLSSNNTPIFFREDVRLGEGWSHSYVSYKLSYHNGKWRLHRKDENDSSWKDAKLVFRLQTDCKYIVQIRTMNVNELTTYVHHCSHSGLNVSKLSEKWEETRPNLNLDQEWPKTASIEFKMMPSY